MNVVSERTRLEEVADYYDSRRGMNLQLVQSAAAIILSHATGPRLLELGCANGVMTEIFAAHFPDIEVVEGAAPYADMALSIVGDLTRVHHCLFDEFHPGMPFNDIVMAGILEHVDDPIALLKRATGWLYPGGSIHIVVPNAESLHRHIGVALGTLQQVDEMHEADHAMGHRRVYTWELLQNHIAESGLTVITRKGNFLKPLSNQQMAEWSEDLLNAFQIVGQQMPDIAAEIYVRCKL